jgi:hypothetical protein
MRKNVEIEWRTIQFFLDSEEFIISEVSVDAMNSKKMRCSCPKFGKFARCKHVKFMQERLEGTNGVFNLTIPPEVDDEEAYDAVHDTELFRQLVLKFGKIEVI